MCPFPPPRGVLPGGVLGCFMSERSPPGWVLGVVYARKVSPRVGFRVFYARKVSPGWVVKGVLCPEWLSRVGFREGLCLEWLSRMGFRCVLCPEWLSLGGYPSLISLLAHPGDTLPPVICPFVGPPGYTSSVAHPVLPPGVHDRVDRYALLVTGPQVVGMTSRKGPERVISHIIDRKGRPEGAIIGVFCSNSIRERREASRS